MNFIVFKKRIHPNKIFKKTLRNKVNNTIKHQIKEEF